MMQWLENSVAHASIKTCHQRSNFNIYLDDDFRGHMNSILSIMNLWIIYSEVKKMFNTKSNNWAQIKS
jgi:hypothetical protein